MRLLYQLLVITAVIAVILIYYHHHVGVIPWWPTTSATTPDYYIDAQRIFDAMRDESPSDDKGGGQVTAIDIYQTLGEVEPVQPFGAPSPNEILPYMYVGNRQDAYDNEKLRALQITHILDMTSGPDRPFDNRDTDLPIIYKKLPSDDNPFFDIRRYFDEAFDFIESAREAHGRILVHCNAGVSRSGIIAAMYVCRKFGMSPQGALTYVKLRRPRIRPNIGFIKQLIDDVED